MRVFWGTRFLVLFSGKKEQEFAASCATKFISPSMQPLPNNPRLIFETNQRVLIQGERRATHTGVHTSGTYRPEESL